MNPGIKKEETGLPPSEAVKLANLVLYVPGSIVSRTLAKSDAGILTLFAFAKGESLSVHTTPYDAYVQVLDGEVELEIGGNIIPAKAGETVLMPANVPHGVNAVNQFKMLLTMIRG